VKERISLFIRLTPSGFVDPLVFLWLLALGAVLQLLLSALFGVVMRILIGVFFFFFAFIFMGYAFVGYWPLGFVSALCSLCGSVALFNEEF
jgi:hypothetical protein